MMMMIITPMMISDRDHQGANVNQCSTAAATVRRRPDRQTPCTVLSASAVTVTVPGSHRAVTGPGPPVLVTAAGPGPGSKLELSSELPSQ